MGRIIRKAWTEDDDRMLIDLRCRGTRIDDIAKQMGRARQVIRRKLGPEGFRVVQDTDFKFEVPAEVLSDRARRSLLRPTTLTAAICGDPLPGMSALDRRRA